MTGELGDWATNWQRPTEPDGGLSQLGYRWPFMESGEVLVPCALAALGTGYSLEATGNPPSAKGVNLAVCSAFPEPPPFLGVLAK